MAASILDMIGLGGGAGGASGGGGIAGLLEDVDPRAMAIAGALKNLGQVAGPSRIPVGIGQTLAAAGAGLGEGMMQAGQMQALNAMRALTAAERAQKLKQQQSMDAGRERFMAGLSPEQQTMFAADPAKFLEASVGRALPKLPEGYMLGEDGKPRLDQNYLTGQLALRGGVAGAEANARVQPELTTYGGKKQIDLAADPAIAAATEGAKNGPLIGRALAIDAGQIRDVGPGSTLVQPGATGPRVLYQSPNPAPGTQQGRLEAGLGELQVEAVKGWKQNADKGVQVLQSISQMRDAINAGYQSGFGADLKATLGNAAMSLGAPKETVEMMTNATSSALFNKAAQQLVMSSLGSLGTGVSNADRDFLASAYASSKDPMEATVKVINYLGSKAQGQISKLSEGYDMVRQGADPLKWEADWNQKMGFVPLEAPAPKTQPAAPGGTGPTLLPEPTQKDFEATALKYNMTVDKVKELYRAGRKDMR